MPYQLWELFPEEAGEEEGVEEGVEEGEGGEEEGEEGGVDGVAAEVVPLEQDQGKASTTTTMPAGG